MQQIDTRKSNRLFVLALTAKFLFVSVGTLAMSVSINPLQSIAGRVDQAVLKAVVKIVSAPNQPNQHVTGTGFLVSREIIKQNTTERAVYLVTNKHVVSNWDLADGSITNYSKTLEVFFYRTSSPSGSTYKALTVKTADAAGAPILGKLSLHPNPAIDIAVVRLDQELSPENKIDLVSFDRSFFIPFSNLINFAGTGDQVFALGYPLGITSLTNSYPIAKAGYIASILGQEFKIDVPVINRNGQQVIAKLEGKILVVDGLIVPGNSGGPVVIPAETKVRINPQTKQFEYTTEPTKNMVTGIVSSGLGGSGLTIVLSSDYIIEVIEKMT